MRMPGRAGLPMVLALVAAASPADAAADKRPIKSAISPEQTSATVALFRRDWVLMNWALRFFDTNGDVTLSPNEAAAAAAAFRKLADVDRDGRITPAEYRLARHYIVTRY